MKLLNLSKKNFIALKHKNFNDEINNFFMHNYCTKTVNYVKLMIKVSMKWKNWRCFRGSTFDTMARRRFVEDQDTILELTGKIQELQNEINCMNDSRDFQDAESVRSGNSHDTSQPVSFTLHPIPGGMLSRSIGMPSRIEGPPRIWDTHGIFGKRFCKPSCVLFSTLPAGIESMEFQKSRTDSLINNGKEWETNTSSRSEMPVWTVSQKFCHP